MIKRMEKTISPEAHQIRDEDDPKTMSATPDPKICCYYFNDGNRCTKSKDECAYLHMSPGKDQIQHTQPVQEQG
jgi:hypothetical protein